MRPTEWNLYAVAGVVAAAGVAAYLAGGWCLTAPALLVGGCALFGVAHIQAEQRALRRYRAALKALRADPADPDLIARVQAAGEAYARATAGGHSEAAIRHDIEDAAGS